MNFFNWWGYYWGKRNKLMQKNLEREIFIQRKKKYL